MIFPQGYPPGKLPVSVQVTGFHIDQGGLLAAYLPAQLIQFQLAINRFPVGTLGYGLLAPLVFVIFLREDCAVLPFVFAVDALVIPLSADNYFIQTLE